LATALGYDTNRLGLIERATLLIGKNVLRQDSFSSFGKLEDIALDLATGKLVMALVSSGSEEWTRVPSGRLFIAATKRNIRINVDKKTFSNAQHVSKTNWTGALDASSLGNIARQFGQEPLAEASSPAEFSSGRELLGRHLTSQTGEPLGQVEDLMVDLQGGRVVFLVVKPVAGPDPDKCLYVLPPASVRLNANGGSLELNASLKDFVAGPNFPKEFWTMLVSPELAARVYQHYARREGGADVADPK
jgi:sporulation protein YlmC with PRC-barrel domain